MIPIIREKSGQEKASDFELCLNFANTLAWHASPMPRENLHSYEDLLAWAAGQGLVDTIQLKQIQMKAAQDQTQAEATLHRAIELREVMYRLFAGHAHGYEPGADDLQLLNEALVAIAPKARIQWVENSYRWSWIEDPDLDRILWPIVRSARELLTNQVVLERVGQCADDRGCGWLFLDLSKNHSRRWCDINDCGNRAKQRRFQQRLREEKGS